MHESPLLRDAMEKVLTVSGPVLRSRLGDPNLPPGPLPLPVWERKGERYTIRDGVGTSLSRFGDGHIGEMKRG